MDGTHLLEYIQTLEARAARQDTLSDQLVDAKGKGKQPQPKPVWLHCSVGTRLEPHEEDDGLLQVNPPTLLPSLYSCSCSPQYRIARIYEASTVLRQPD